MTASIGHVTLSDRWFILLSLMKFGSHPVLCNTFTDHLTEWLFFFVVPFFFLANLVPSSKRFLLLHFLGFWLPAQAGRVKLNCSGLYFHRGLPDGSVVKNLPANAGDAGLIPGSGRSPGERNGNPVQYSCLGNPMDRGAWWATVHGVAESDTT